MGRSLPDIFRVRHYLGIRNISSHARWEFTEVESPHEIGGEKNNCQVTPFSVLTFIIQELDKPH